MTELENFLKHEDWCASDKFWREETVCDCGCSEAQQEYDALRSLLSDALKALEPFAQAEHPWMVSDENFFKLPELYHHIKVELEGGR